MFKNVTNINILRDNTPGSKLEQSPRNILIQRCKSSEQQHKLDFDQSPNLNQSTFKLDQS